MQADATMGDSEALRIGSLRKRGRRRVGVVGLMMLMVSVNAIVIVIVAEVAILRRSTRPVVVGSLRWLRLAPRLPWLDPFFLCVLVFTLSLTDTASTLHSDGDRRERESDGKTYEEGGRRKEEGREREMESEIGKEGRV